MYLGFNRYHWQNFGMATQLIVWFAVSFIIFFIFRNTALHIVLIALNAVSLVGMILVSGYSERMRLLRLKRSNFREKLQLFSEKMINLHSNDELYEHMMQTISQHVDIYNVRYFTCMQYELSLYAPKNNINKTYKISKKDFQNILKSNVIMDSESTILQNIMQDMDLNILLPVKRETALYGLIGLKILNLKSPLNREDVQSIQTIANQMAIAIENNNYIKESEALVKQLTESKIR
ncbi:MAG: hypothetical protein P8X42_04455, partial [Calditrichaceae bacterium]